MSRQGRGIFRKVTRAHAAFEAPRVEAPREMGGFFAVFGAWGRVAGRAAATRAARGMVL